MEPGTPRMWRVSCAVFRAARIALSTAIAPTSTRQGWARSRRANRVARLQVSASSNRPASASCSERRAFSRASETAAPSFWPKSRSGGVKTRGCAAVEQETADDDAMHDQRHGERAAELLPAQVGDVGLGLDQQVLDGERLAGQCGSRRDRRLGVAQAKGTGRNGKAALVTHRPRPLLAHLDGTGVGAQRRGRLVERALHDLVELERRVDQAVDPLQRLVQGHATGQARASARAGRRCGPGARPSGSSRSISACLRAVMPRDAP